MSTDTLSKNLGTWKAQIANVKPRLPQMPQLGETVQGFEALVVEAEELQSTQDVYRSKLRETTLRSQGHLAARAQLPQPAGRRCAERLRRRQPPAVGARRQAAPAEEPPPPDARTEGRRSEGGARGRGGGARSREGEEGLIPPISK